MEAASGSRGWRLAFRALYRLIRWLDPLLRLWWRLDLPPLGRSVLVVVPGRRTGRSRPVLVTLLVVDGVGYVGHPNGAAPWTGNVEAARFVGLRDCRGSESAWRAIRLHPGPERTAVVTATGSQQPFPGNVIYTLARAHVAAVGVYFRLEPEPEPRGDPMVARNAARSA